MNLEPEHSDTIRTLVRPDILLNRIRTAVRTLTVTTYADLTGIDTRARRITRQPLITELREATRPSTGRTVAGAGDGRPIPLNVGAYELLRTIEARIAADYESATDETPAGTAEQLLADWYETFATAHAMGETNLAQLEKYAARVTGWATAISDLFDPPRTREYPLCPACGYTHTIRRDANGKAQIKCLTLRHYTDGRAIAACAHCDARWEGLIVPDRTGDSVHGIHVSEEIRELHIAIEDNIAQYGPVTIIRLAPPRIDDTDDDTDPGDTTPQPDALAGGTAP
ncbi:hypothetical protein RWH43_10660 [Microbacterium sp. KSW2-21]|uniref:DUF7341 domain-containing protein n=1 Tax=Microbacterium algihabitans TaxID=3075992 RepID=A0ABU3RX90_9MICO|nr:hypothetical protein [Microbacterium sp. KSW2-21]MDU0327215.1 hypothetical protein [Microbacterium sp. KSW2-21]